MAWCKPKEAKGSIWVIGKGKIVVETKFHPEDVDADFEFDDESDTFPSCEHPKQDRVMARIFHENSKCVSGVEIEWHVKTPRKIKWSAKK